MNTGLSLDGYMAPEGVCIDKSPRRTVCRTATHRERVEPHVRLALRANGKELHGGLTYGERDERLRALQCATTEEERVGDSRGHRERPPILHWLTG